MPKTIKQHLETAEQMLDNGDEGNLAHSLLAIAKMMREDMTAPVVMAELEAELALARAQICMPDGMRHNEPCQCKAESDELAAAAPELLRLIQDAMASAASAYCPWCHEYFEDGHYPGCPGVEILKRFEDRVKPPTKPRKQFEQDCPGPLYLAVDADGKKHLVRDRVPVELFEPCKQNTPPGVVPPGNRLREYTGRRGRPGY